MNRGVIEMKVHGQTIYLSIKTGWRRLHLTETKPLLLTIYFSRTCLKASLVRGRNAHKPHKKRQNKLSVLDRRHDETAVGE